MKIKKEYVVQGIASEHIVVVQGEIGVDMTKVIALNETSAWLWEELADTDFQAEDVAHLLCSRYSVDEPTALADAHKWIESLKECNAIEI